MATKKEAVKRKMKKRVAEWVVKKKIKKIKKNFTKEFKKQLRFGITAAIGFLIAYAWREPILTFFGGIASVVTKNTAEFQTDFITATMITVLGVVIILLISRWLK